MLSYLNMQNNINDHERYGLLLSTMECQESNISFRAAYRVWTTFRQLTIAEAVRLGEGLVRYSPDDDLFAGFCAANYVKCLTTRHYIITDVVFTREENIIGWVFCYRDSPLNIECHQVPLLQYDKIKHSHYGNYFFTD